MSAPGSDMHTATAGKNYTDVDGTSFAGGWHREGGGSKGWCCALSQSKQSITVAQWLLTMIGLQNPSVLCVQVCVLFFHLVHAAL